ncbi:MAG: alpha/beta fold hydrolase [Roseovarius sp.]|nr:alpha/beta fold hydrolase [Roseovarius sp.]
MLNRIDHGASTDRPGLLIAHGLYGSARNWGVIARRLSDRRRVSVVDMRNHGASPWFDTHSYEDMAADLAEVITDLGGPLDVLGHSMGGKAAMVLALTRPDLVNRLIVADVAPVAYGHSQIQYVEAMQAVDLARVERRSDAGAQLLERVDDPALVPFFLQALDVKQKRWMLNLDTLAREMPKILGFPGISGVYEGKCLFLTGARSRYVTPEHRPRIKALFPRAQFAKIPGAGHWLHAEKPREFEAAVREWLDRSG